MDHFMPVRLYTGERCIERHRDIFLSFGRRCAIITGQAAAQKSGALADVKQALQACGIAFWEWNGVTQNPPVSSCLEAGRFARENGAEFIFGIGGGSALDAAKAAAVFAANPALDEDGFYRKEWPNPPLPILLAGTTAGTGSEVTKVSVLTDSRKRKHSVHDDRMYASVSFGDSRYTMTLPLSVTLTTGIDILAHCTESYFSRKADDLSRTFAIRGIRLLAEPLSAAAEGGELSAEDRRKLYEASIYGGLAINTTGTNFPHNVGYYLTERFGVPHGFACATFLPDLLVCAREYDAAYAEGFYRETGLTEKNLTALVEKCLPGNRILLSEEEITEILPRWENNSSVSNTRGDVPVSKIRTILEQKFTHS